MTADSISDSMSAMIRAAVTGVDIALFLGFAGGLAWQSRVVERAFYA